MPNYTSIEPFFAPLSKSMIIKALSLQPEIEIPATLDVQQIVSAFTTKCTLLRERLTQPRYETFKQIQEAVKNNEFRTEWVLSRLAEYTPKRRSSGKKP